jgi:hypothetical protein
MLAPLTLQRKLGREFTEPQATLLAEVIHDAYSDLVHTSDFNELKEIVRELAQAQFRTERRLEELAQAQFRTERRVEELTQAQSRTERSIEKLAQQVGGLSDRIGGDLEDSAYIVLFDLLKREFGWQVGELKRSWQRWDGQEEEVDIFGEARDPGRPDLRIWIVGETKFNLTLKDVKRFTQKVDRARQNLTGEVYPVCFCYRARPEVQQAVKEAGYHLVYSYGRMG